MTSPALLALKARAEYRAERERIFPSPNSFDWYIRQNRARLIAAGALLKIRGTWFVHEPRFDDFVLRGGQEAA